MTVAFLRAVNDDRAAIEKLLFGILADNGLTPDPDSTNADLPSL
jgi:hypothetical protein